MTRYLVLLALRWLPVGIIVPISVLLPLDRGLTLAQVGALSAVQGVTVMLLELPTGGLSDSLGRRPVLLLAGVVDLTALGPRWDWPVGSRAWSRGFWSPTPCTVPSTRSTVPGCTARPTPRTGPA
jgi:MFS family permease